MMKFKKKINLKKKTESRKLTCQTRNPDHETETA